MGDVAAFRTTLVSEGVGDELLDDLTRQFAAMWMPVGDDDDDAGPAGVSIVLGGGGDDA